jgi:hypothetical protein
VLAVLLATVVPMTTAGCFGRFALTRKVYEFNRDISSDRWVRWISFLVLSVVLIYPAGLAIDLVFANSIEFWGGVNPFAAGEPTTRYAHGPNGELVAATLIEPNVVQVTITDRAGAVQTLRVVREPASLAAYDESGQLVARVGDVNGAAARLDAR